MKAAYINQIGSPDVLTYGDLPDPKPGRTQCLVKVGAADVNPIDTYIRAGLVPAKMTFPWVLGHDLAGTVLEAGPGVKRFLPGNRVWGSGQGFRGTRGTYAELCAVDERYLYPTPDSMSDEEIVALSLVGITAHLGLVREARLRKG